MTIRSRVKNLEKQHGGKLEVIAPRVFCAKTESGLTEASDTARFVGGSVSKEFPRAGSEYLQDFRDRVMKEGCRLVSEVHPNTVFVYAGVLDSKYAQSC